jgi:hypothetical protein
VRVVVVEGVGVGVEPGLGDTAAIVYAAEVGKLEEGVRAVSLCNSCACRVLIVWCPGARVAGGLRGLRDVIGCLAWAPRPFVSYSTTSCKGKSE